MGTARIVATAILFLACGIGSARSTGLTEVDGRLECPDLGNLHACASRFENALMTANPGLLIRKDKVLKVALPGGFFFDIPDESGLFNVVETAAAGRFVVLREQLTEGDSWHILDRENRTMTEIFAYPLFSPDNRRFVVAGINLDSRWTATILDLYEVSPQSITRVFRGIPEEMPDWGPSHVSWLNNESVDFMCTRMTDPTLGNFRLTGAGLKKGASGWEMYGVK